MLQFTALMRLRAGESRNISKNKSNSVTKFVNPGYTHIFHSSSLLQLSRSESDSSSESCFLAGFLAFLSTGLTVLTVNPYCAAITRRNSSTPFGFLLIAAFLAGGLSTFLADEPVSKKIVFA